MYKIYQSILTLVVFIVTLGIISCSGNGDNSNPSEKLKEMCIRQCVLETGGASVCDTQCSCASEAVSKGLSNEQLEALLGSLSTKDEGDEMSETEKMYKYVFYSCNPELK